MFEITEEHRSELTDLCRRYGVQQLELFGSAASRQFDPARSDLDFIVTFDSSDDLFHRYFGLNEALERLFGRKVDLVMTGATNNPRFIESARQTRQLVYAA